MGQGDILISPHNAGKHQRGERSCQPGRRFPHAGYGTMKASFYNHIVDLEDGKALLYNSASGALAEIDPESRTRLDRVLAMGQAETDADRELFDGLVEGGYLIDEKVDETAMIRARSRRQKIEGATLSLTIAPTLACNFCCNYCFESQSNVRMKPDMEQALLRFAAREMARADKLLVTWFGGEPTLCLPTIERIQRGLAELAERHKIKFHPASIVTNGYLLDKTMAERLKEMGIGSAQITIDGPEEVHDRRRKLHSGRGTYRQIMDNLAESAEILRVGIRINVDRDNAESAHGVLADLERRGILSKVQVHFAQVTSGTGVCADMRDRCFSGEEYSRSQVSLYRALIERGIYRYDYPQVFGGVHCGALSDHYYVVGPGGLLFRCWEELSSDPAMSIGSILTEALTPDQQKNRDRYRNWEPLTMSGCAACRVLPICMGGCPIMGMRQADPAKGFCMPWKYNLKDMLYVRYLCDAGREVAP